LNRGPGPDVAELTGTLNKNATRLLRLGARAPHLLAIDAAGRRGSTDLAPSGLRPLPQRRLWNSLRRIGSNQTRHSAGGRVPFVVLVDLRNLVLRYRPWFPALPQQTTSRYVR
jgi:hypothetical protein